MAAMCTLWVLNTTAKADDNNVRNGIEAMTKRFVTAYRNRDVQSIRRELTPDFAWKRPNGTSLKADAAMEGVTRHLDRVVRVDVMNIKLDNLSMLGDSASATAICLFRGSVRDSAGAIRKVTSKSKYKYYWVKTKKGWRIDGITDLNGWSESGKQVQKR
jgi:ketosteroid isomerase-like protein